MVNTQGAYGMAHFDGDVQPGAPLDANNQHQVAPEDQIAEAQSAAEIEAITRKLGPMAETDSIQQAIRTRVRQLSQ